MCNYSRDKMILLSFINHHTNFKKRRFLADDVLEIKNENGEIINLTIDMLGNIYNAETHEKIASSDLTHEYFGSCKMPTKWILERK